MIATQERAAGVVELRRAGGAGRDPQDTIGWRNWVAWCVANGCPGRPEPDRQEQLLMLFLLHNYEVYGWRRDTCAQYAREVSRVWSMEGASDPRTLNTDALLSWLGKQPRPNKVEVGGFGADQVVALGAALQVAPTMLPAGHQPDDPALALAALVALADAADVSPLQRRGPGDRNVDSTVWGLPSSAFVNQSGRLVVTYRSERFLIRKDRHPEHFQAVSAALARADQLGSDEQPPLVRLWPRLLESRGNGHKSAVLHAWVRATTGRGGQDPLRKNIASNRHAFQKWWDHASPDDRAWLILNAGDREIARRRSDLAYFYGGITTALRHASWCELVLGEVAVKPEGLVLNVPPTKHKSGNADLGQGKPGGWLHKPIAHQRDKHGCVAHCPACAVLAHLDVRRRHGATGKDLLFPPLHTDAARFSTGAGTNALRRVWALAEEFLGHPDRAVEVRIGTRSLRVTAATLARVAKMPLWRIQQLLDHRDPGVTELYIRIHDAFADEDLVLAVRPPAALAADAADEQ